MDLKELSSEQLKEALAALGRNDRRLAELHTGFAAIDRDPLGYATAWGGLVQAVRLARSRAKPKRRFGLFRGSHE